MEESEDDAAETYRDVVRDPMLHGPAGYNLAPLCRPRSSLLRVGRVVYSPNPFFIALKDFE